MKVCMVMSTPFPPCDGIGYHVYSLSKELIRNGHQITVITRGEGGEFTSDEFEGISILRAPFLPTYPLHIWTHGIWADRHVRSCLDDCDIVHYHTPLVPLLDHSAPAIVTVHSSMIEEIDQMEAGFFLRKMMLQGMTRTFTRWFMDRTLRSANRVIAVSTSVQDELRRHFGNFDNVEVVPNGVDTEFFVPNPEPSEKDYVLYVGRLSYRKGLLELMDAFERVSRSSHAELVLCGKGPLRPVLEGLAIKKGIQERVRFTGFVTRQELLSLYQHARAFVAASSYETGPLTVLEAMSCGIPVVVTKVGIMPDVIKDGENGRFVEIGDSSGLSATLSEVLSDRDGSSRLGANARAAMLDGYRWQGIASRIADLYEKAAYEGRSADPSSS